VASPNLATSRLPPIPLMGTVYLVYSQGGAMLLITVPQLLAARHMPEPTIASLTALGLLGGTLAFLLSPMLDVRFSRRNYAVAMAGLAALLYVAALTQLDNPPLLGLCLFCAANAIGLYQAAVSGWLTSLIPSAQESRLAAWFNVANIGGFGVFAFTNITLMRLLPAPFGAMALGGLMLLPLLIFPALPAPGPDRRLARESFAQFFAHVVRMLRAPSVLRLLLILALPAACFAMTNTLGGLGHVYGASEAFVGLVAGIGVSVAGVIGSLAVPPLAARLSPFRLYLAVGLCGALTTLGMIALPLSPASFAIALVASNIFQAAAFATAFTLIMGEIGKGNPLAATEFSVLLAAMQVPLVYMQWLDGNAFGLGGAPLMLAVDGGMGIAGCAGIALLLRWRVQARAVL
jgi:PAT family beta-lactamase induction signal transducer AmpG